MGRNIRISQCMIVKNEEKNIERALSWGRDVVWEQIVVDTGSTDHTVEIAKRMGARLFHFDWIDDFAAAKNYAIEKAGGDWIAFLDADEYLSEEDAKKLPLLLNELSRREYNALIARWIQTDGDVSWRADGEGHSEPADGEGGREPRERRGGDRGPNLSQSAGPSLSEKGP